MDAPGPIDGVQFRLLGFDEIACWQDDDHLAAFQAFLPGARRLLDQPYKARASAINIKNLNSCAQDALGIATIDETTARAFFERRFQPFEICPNEFADQSYPGFVTGYFEPEVMASQEQSDEFPIPLLKRPPDLIDINDGNRPANMDASFRYGQISSGIISEYSDRSAIMTGVLDDQNLELVWLKNKVDAFFIHVQGSAKLRFENGAVMRVTYAAKTGHPYTSLAKLLCKRLEIEPANMTADRLASWMHSNPDKLDELLARNRSYIFFKEQTGLNPQDGPVGAAKIPLIAGRSLAVDRTIHTFGIPIWVSTKSPLPGDASTFNRLMMAHDTGSAIIGPARGDIYVGSGDEAGIKAGKIRHSVQMVMLVPK